MDNVNLSQKDVANLLGSQNTWIKVLTYRTFPKKCPPGTRQMILNELIRMRATIEEVSPSVEAQGKVTGQNQGKKRESEDSIHKSQP